MLRGALPAGLLLLGTACNPMGGRPQEEEKDPAFLSGRSRVEEKDYSGAVECFERALRNNPQSAAAHLELGLLYYRNLSDYAAAIYHFDRFNRLRPQSSKRDVINQFIDVCKRDLAADVPLGSVPLLMQRELDRLTQTNKLLKLEIEQLRLQLAQRAPQPAAPQTADPQTNVTAAAPPTLRQPTNQQPPNTSASLQTPPHAASPRTHTVRHGDTFYSIARANGTTVAAIKAANPGVDPQRLRTGQVLKLPPR